LLRRICAKPFAAQKRTLYRSSSPFHPVDTPVTSVCWSTHDEMISLLKSLKLRLCLRVFE